MSNCSVDHTIHQILFPTVYIAVFIIGLPTNLLSLYHSYLQIRQRNELGIYLCNLTISDLLYLISLPFWVQYMLQHDDWVLSRALCILSGLFLYQNIYISIGFLCFISINRFLAVAYPLRFEFLHTRKAAVFISVLIWIKEIPVCGFYIHSQVLSKDNENDTLCFEQYPMQSEDRYLNIYKLSIGFFLPLILLIYSYYKVLVVVHKSHGLERERKLRIKKLVSGTIIIFLACFVPYHIFLMIRTIFEYECKFADNVFELYHFGLLLTSLNCVADPILYCFISPSSHGWLTRFLDPVTNLIPCRMRQESEASEMACNSPITAKISLVPQRLEKQEKK
ncbi:ovarian cancer G-protein coupled receptor 1-like [Carcharodon carcharias]|uniref:ovarian cancer G-protein coupled receptor 1-like n=1 Tax=Carcharodon carcharias TaxID=13397 RepID=UPI001B7EBFF9|nr:ovarian cancer G-protein coupled receptor 1-like [Carcharodon carcharias]XP_041070383.1 ovarian cancer G-protein coupled receptor 1-like [Carcharodon carcharias]XP_041070385.1 ovarian cancer G-protein coupled receptor 1-like [Carcharodon carcharias]XP_041070386.1 ovarian cancer G-protein coupled receptor 1-like [Carcharodon carcharias]